MAQRSKDPAEVESAPAAPGDLLGAEPRAAGSLGDGSAPQWLQALRSGEPRDIPSLVGAILRNLDLSGLDLTGARLQGADLTGSDLTKSRLLGADLTGAQLHGVTARGAEFAGAKLIDATLSEGVFDDAGFGSADLRGARVQRASLRNATLTSADARGATFAASDLTGARMVDANFEGADFQAAVLAETDLTGVQVAGASFRRARLKCAKLLGVVGFASADWIFVELDDTSLNGGVLLREFIHDQNFLHEFRHQSKYHEWIYRLWWLTSDCGRSVVRWGVCSFALAVFFAFIYTFVGLSYGSGYTWLSPFYFSVVTFTTLGFGDIVPVTAAAQGVVIFEVVLGYVMLGGMLSLISNKLARRAG